VDEVRKALRERERQSLTLAALIGIGLCITYALLSSQLPVSGVTPLYGAMMMAPVAATLAATLFFLRHDRGVTVVGYILVLVLAVMFFAYPHILYAVTDSVDASPAFILKSVQVLFGPIIIAFVALTLKPALAVGIALAIVALHGVNIGIVLADPRTIVTDDTVEGLLGPGLLRSRIYVDLALLGFAGLLGVAVTIVARRTILRAVELERVDSRLRRYFSPDIVEHLAKSGSWPAGTGGVTRDVVILFSDIEEFTRMVRDLPPDETVAILAEYRDRMLSTIFRHQGTLDKFIGDGILAVFGMFGSDGNAADQALAAAIEMNAALEAMNRIRAERELAPLRHRIGLHAGPALVGNVAAAGQMEFTVVGDTVNMASRIEQAGKILGRQLLLSDAVCSRLTSRTACQSLGAVTLPGYPEPIEVFGTGSASTHLT